MPDSWLEVRMHTECPAFSQLEWRFPGFFSVVKQILICYPDSTLHCTLLMLSYRCEHQKSVLIL
jgi:hypothetical protein